MDEEPPARGDLEVEWPARLHAWPSQGEDGVDAGDLPEMPAVAPEDPRPIALWIAEQVDDRGEPVAYLPAASVMELWRGRDGTLAQLCDDALDAALARVRRDSALGDDEWYPSARPPVALLIDAGFIRGKINVEADVLDRIAFFLGEEHGEAPPRNRPGAVLAWAFAVALVADGVAPPESVAPAVERGPARGRLPRWQAGSVEHPVGREELVETVRSVLAGLELVA